MANLWIYNEDTKKWNEVSKSNPVPVEPIPNYAARFKIAETNTTAKGSSIEVDNTDGTERIFLTVNEIEVSIPAGAERRYNFGSFTGFITELDTNWDSVNPDKEYEVRIYD